MIMAEVVRVPELGSEINQVTVSKWLVNVGDKVRQGDVIAEMETEKAVFELETYEDGYLLYREEGVVAINEVVCIIGEKDEDIFNLLKELPVSGALGKNLIGNLSKPFLNFFQGVKEVEPMASERAVKSDFFKGEVRSIRTFIGAKDFELSRSFYKDLGFEESEISADMSYFSIGRFGFYLQKYFVKKWVDNSMIFMEVQDAQETYEHVESLQLHKRYKGVRLTLVKEEDWGKECFLHDPSGILWHFGEFY